MEIQGTHQFNAPLPAVWDALLNPTILAKALPGGDQLERVGENDYKAAMNVRVGPVQGRFEGQVALTDIEPQRGYRMKVSGTGTPGFLSGEGTLTLAEKDGGTQLTYSGDVQVGGRIAAVGQRLIDSTAKSMIRQGLKTLDEQLRRGNAPDLSEPDLSAADAPVESTPASRPAPEAQGIPASTRSNAATTAHPGAAPAAPAPSPPSAQASGVEFGRMAFDVAKEVAQDLAADYVPRAQHPQLIAFIAGALAMLAFVVLVRLVQRD